MICKKFEVSCPTEDTWLVGEIIINSTFTPPTTLVPDTAFNVTNGSCRPHYFIFNSQVTKYNLCFSERKIIGKKRGRLFTEKKNFFLKILFVYLLLERGEGREKERERNINVWLPLVHHPPNWGPGMRPEP